MAFSCPRELIGMFILGIALGTFMPLLAQIILLLGLIYVVKPDLYNIENIIILKANLQKLLNHLKNSKLESEIS